MSPTKKPVLDAIDLHTIVHPEDLVNRSLEYLEDDTRFDITFEGITYKATDLADLARDKIVQIKYFLEPQIVKLNQEIEESVALYGKDVDSTWLYKVKKRRKVLTRQYNIVNRALTKANAKKKAEKSRNDLERQRKEKELLKKNERKISSEKSLFYHRCWLVAQTMLTPETFQKICDRAREDLLNE